MAQPLVTSVTIGDIDFDALSVSVGLTSLPNVAGIPMMGSLQTHIEISVDLHDDVNMPYTKLRALFDLAKLATRDKIKDIKIEFWKDENAEDAICVYNLKGWISHFQTFSGGDGNHTLMLSLQPSLTTDNFTDIDMSN